MEIIKPGYTRVSEIISQWPRFEGIDPRILAEKALLGTNVHRAIAAYWDEVYIPLEPKEEPYFDSFLKWLELIKTRAAESEVRLYNDTLMVTGGIDAFMHLGGEIILTDFKTSLSPSPCEWQLQGGLYHQLAEYNGYNIANCVLFVQLSKEGKVPTVHTYAVDHNLKNACMASIVTYRFREKFLQKNKKID